MKQAGIYVNDVFCGTLTEDEEGYHFCYDKEYLAWQSATPLSPTMPLTEEQYDKLRSWGQILNEFVEFTSNNLSP